MWQNVPRHPGESDFAFDARCVDRLGNMYQRNGYSYFSRFIGRLMGRIVRPTPRDPADVLMNPPDPPPLSDAGRSMPSSLGRPRKPPASRPTVASISPTTPSGSGGPGGSGGSGRSGRSVRSDPPPMSSMRLPSASRPARGSATRNQDDDSSSDDIYGASPLQPQASPW